MMLALGLISIIVGATIVWKFRSPDGKNSHPLLEVQFMSVLVALGIMSLIALGFALIISELFALQPV